MPKKPPTTAIKFTDEDFRTLKNLAAIQCTLVEAASVLEIAPETLISWLKREHGTTWLEFFNQHSAKGRASLRRKQHEVAMEGSERMLIHLGKQYLEQTDTQNIQIEQPLSERDVTAQLLEIEALLGERRKTEA